MWLISSFCTPTTQLAVRQRCPKIAKYYNFYTESGEVCRLIRDLYLSVALVWQVGGAAGFVFVI